MYVLFGRSISAVDIYIYIYTSLEGSRDNVANQYNIELPIFWRSHQLIRHLQSSRHRHFDIVRNLKESIPAPNNKTCYFLPARQSHHTDRQSHSPGDKHPTEKQAQPIVRRKETHNRRKRECRHVFLQPTGIPEAIRTCD